MQNFQGIVLIWTRTNRDTFQSTFQNSFEGKIRISGRAQSERTDPVANQCSYFKWKVDNVFPSSVDDKFQCTTVMTGGTC